ncbi:MAG TPA: hypothetical protein VK364_05555 [Hymenobacter sp.]|nr:hypothetical protein [Hymenobacter sp.]
MKTVVPAFVLRHNGTPTDWIEPQDRLPIEEVSFAYQERNQEDWWKQNKQIRDLLSRIEQHIESRSGRVLFLQFG